MVQFAMVNVFLVAVGAIIAIREKRFTHRQLGEKSLPYAWHGGMYADLIIITFICYWTQPYRDNVTEGEFGLAYLIATVATVGMHIAYTKTQTIPSHIIDPFDQEERLTMGGYWHAVYSVWTMIMLASLFFFSEDAPKFWPCVAMTAFVPLAIMQPGWYNAKRITGTGTIDAFGWIQAVAVWGLIWGIYFLT